MRFKFTDSRPRLWYWLMCAAAAVSLFGVGIFGELVVASEKTGLTVTFAIFLAVFTLLTGFCGFIAFKTYRKCEKPVAAKPIAFALAAAFVSYAISEFCMNALIFKLYPLYNLLGYAMYAVPFLLGAVIFKKPKIWFCVLEFVFSFYSLAQYYITKFRGAPIKFTDLMNIQSAVEISDEYKFFVSFTVVVVLLETAGLMFITIRTKLVTETLRPRMITLGSCAAMTLLFFSITGYTYDYGIRNRVICLNFSGAEETRTARSVGSLLMFYYDGVYNHVNVPADYSTETAEQLIDSYEQGDTSEVGKPVIIGILNESFADFSHIAPIKTDVDYLENWHSLTENTVKGYVTVSPYGGYSCNSEFEFLSGNTMHFLPLGSAAYTNYLDSAQDSIVTSFNDMGFETVAFTPCRRGLWNIGEAYKFLDFKRCYFSDTINLRSKQRYNDEPADEAVFDRLCSVVDQRNPHKGAFYWVTTMQNHAPFNVDVDGGLKLEEPYDLSAERYLNSIRLSDQAFGKLTEHFKDYEEQVVIVMFGDHYPHIEGYADGLYGSALADLGVEDYSRIHQTPFIIWSNKPIESKFIEDISLNYLADEVFKAAGLPLSPVQQELEHVREQIPIISGFGYKTSDGKWHHTGDDAGDYTDILNDYATMQYYRMFDEDRRILKNAAGTN